MSSEDKSKDVMNPEHKPQKKISRKSFLKGSVFAMLSAAAASEGLAVGKTTKAIGETTKSENTGNRHHENKARSYFTHEADVVIIGGGIAGLAAARMAMKGGSSVLVIDKGPAGHSGASGMAWGHAMVTNEFFEGDIKQTLLALLLDVQGVADQDFFMAVCETCRETKPVAYAEQLGTVQIRGDDGKPVNANNPNAPIALVYEHRHRHTVEQLQRAGLHIVDNTMAVDIVLAPDGHVAGAVGIDLKSGDAHLFRAKTVIVATGGYVWASGCTINGPESTGEGHAMFIKHGLAMKDMEFFQVDFESARPYGTRSKEKDQIEIGFGPDLNGDDFMDAYNKNHVQFNKKYFSNPQFSAYPGAAFQGTVTTAIKEILHGNGTTGAGSNNGILLGLATIPTNHKLQATIMIQPLIDCKLLGFSHGEYAELLPEFYGSGGMPGVKAKTCETSIPGLYSAMHTLSEMGSILAWTQGCMSGKNAAIQATSMGTIPAFSDRDVQNILNKAYGLLEATPSNPLRATQIHRNIQRTFYKGLHVIRNEKGMQAALDELLRIQKEDLPRLNVPVKSRQFNRDWRNAMEVESMLLCSIATAYASLYRKETRPFHYRTDYPVMDNDNWLVNVWVTMKKDGTWSVHKTPVVDSVYSVAEMKKMLIPVDMREPNES